MTRAWRGVLSVCSLALFGCPAAGGGETATGGTSSGPGSSGGESSTSSTGGDDSTSSTTGDQPTGGQTTSGSVGSVTDTSGGFGTTGAPQPGVCGDGVLNLDEGCDLGDDNDDHGACTTSCQPALCGDGLVHAGVEQCDDGDADACPDNCGVMFSYTPPRIVAGEMHTCVLSDAGKVRCWGGTHIMIPAYGQIGLGVDEGIGDEPGEMPPPDVDLGAKALQIVAGEAHTCALLEGGAVKCWGRGDTGALGLGNKENVGDEPGEMPPPDVDLGGPAAQLSAGDSHTCALMASGAVKCWGSDAFGQIGSVGHNVGDDPNEMPPQDILLSGKVVQIDAGSIHSCALLESGTPVCWGSITPPERLDPPQPVGFGGFVVELAHGDRRLCARLTGGRIRCRGLNSGGANGYGHDGEVFDPIAAGDIPVGAPVKRLVAGENHTCALLESGALRCWGYNAEGQLGYGHTDSLGDAPGELPTPDLALGGVALDVAAYGHTCAILQGGKIRCWGPNWGGVLGLGHLDTIGDQPGEMPPPDVPVY